MALLDASEIDKALAGLDDGWTGGPDKLTRSIEFADFPTAVEFVVRLAPKAEERDHHPDLGIHWRRVDVELSTHSEGGVTDKDADLAAVVDEIASQLPKAG